MTRGDAEPAPPKHLCIGSDLVCHCPVHAPSYGTSWYGTCHGVPYRKEVGDMAGTGTGGVAVRTVGDGGDEQDVVDVFDAEVGDADGGGEAGPEVPVGEDPRQHPAVVEGRAEVSKGTGRLVETSLGKTKRLAPWNTARRGRGLAPVMDGRAYPLVERRGLDRGKGKG